MPPGTRSWRLPTHAEALLWGTVAAGLLALGGSALAAVRHGWAIGLLPFAALAVLAEVLSVQVYASGRQRISLSFTVAATMAAVTAYPLAAPIVSAAGACLHAVRLLQRRQVSKALYNVANPSLAAGAAGAVYLLLSPRLSARGEWWELASASAAVVVFYAVNVGLISLMISRNTGKPLGRVVREAGWFGPSQMALGLTGAYISGLDQQIGLRGLIVFGIPLLVLRFTLTMYARQSERTIETLRAAKANVEQAHGEKDEVLRGLIDMVASIIDARDVSVSGHSRRVAKFAAALGGELGHGQQVVATLYTAGLFHDLGKVGIPEAILHKPSRLTESEYETVKAHAAVGQRILGEVKQLDEIAGMVGEHHERYDGTGYPCGLRGESISLGGRILVVADALETMLADRPYSQRRPLHDALAELDRCAGGQFDPAVVGAVHRVVARRGAEFFIGMDDDQRHDWAPAASGSADRILLQALT